MPSGKFLNNNATFLLSFALLKPQTSSSFSERRWWRLSTRCNVSIITRSPGFNRVQLGLPGLSRVQMDSPGFKWVHLGSNEFKWVQLEIWKLLPRKDEIQLKSVLGSDTDVVASMFHCMCACLCVLNLCIVRVAFVMFDFRPLHLHYPGGHQLS